MWVKPSKSQKKLSLQFPTSRFHKKWCKLDQKQYDLNKRLHIIYNRTSSESITINTIGYRPERANKSGQLFWRKTLSSLWKIVFFSKVSEVFPQEDRTKKCYRHIVFRSLKSLELSNFIWILHFHFFCYPWSLTILWNHQLFQDIFCNCLRCKHESYAELKYLLLVLVNCCVVRVESKNRVLCKLARQDL